MAVIVHTSTPSTLLKNIKSAIDEGHIETWAYDEDGDFTHTAEQWKNRAWLRPTVASGALLLGLLGQHNKDMTTVIYGIYHGRYIEMLLTHFDDSFTTAAATAQKETGVDLFK